MGESPPSARLSCSQCGTLASVITGRSTTAGSSPSDDVTTCCGDRSQFEDEVGLWDGTRQRLGAAEENALLKDVEPLLQCYLNDDLQALMPVNRNKVPSKKAVAGITEDLLQLVFPGFFVDAKDDREFAFDVALLWKGVKQRLTTEIAKCISGGDAKDVTREFMGSIPEIRRLLSMDIEATRAGDPAAKSVEEVIVAYPCIETIAVYRLANQLVQLGVPVLPRIMSEWAHSRTGVDIHPSATIGTHFFIDHGTDTVIGGTAIIGNHVRLYHGVTLGAASLSLNKIAQLREGGKRHPTIGDNVTVYLHAMVLGDITIGKDSTILACSLVTENVPENHTVKPNHPIGCGEGTPMKPTAIMKLDKGNK